MRITIRVRPERFTEKQWEFITLQKRFKAYIGGVGSGKTYAGAAAALIEAASRPKTTGLVVAPTYPMIRDVVLPAVFKLFPRAVVKRYLETKHELVLAGGSKIIFRSADKPDKLRGLNLAWAWIDEAAYVPRSLWDIVIGRLRDRRGSRRAWITTTPKGRNWVWEVFVKNPTPEHGWVHATTYDNVYLPEDYIKSLEARYKSEFFEQEVLGKFVKFEGLVYKEFDESKHIVDELPEFEEVVAGVDWGYTNPAVVLVVGFDSDGRAYVAEEFYRRGVLIEQIVEVAKKMRDRWGVRIFYCDPSEPTFIAQFQKAGLKAVPASNDVIPGIAAVKSLLSSDALFIHRSAQSTIDEILSYRWKETKDGEMMDVPEKENDHAMDALRYAVYSHLKRPKERPRGRAVLL